MTAPGFLIIGCCKGKCPKTPKFSAENRFQTAFTPGKSVKRLKPSTGYAQSKRGITPTILENHTPKSAKNKAV
jgi:hypothetical protein